MNPEQLIPRALSDYADPAGASLVTVLAERVRAEPFNAIATTIFLLAIVHTFQTARLTAWAHRLQHAADAKAEARLEPPRPSIAAEVLHFFGEVEVVFGLWAAVLLAAMALWAGPAATTHYFNETVHYTEPLFVVVIMALAATRPVVGLAEAALGRLARLAGGSVTAWWASILVIGPVLGSFITEPAAMTICALLLTRQFYARRPSMQLRYATLGLLFVNVSIGGTLTTFAAPPVLIVARPWEWDTAFMLTHFGYRAIVAILVSTLVYLVAFRYQLRELDLALVPAPEDARTPAGAPAPPLPVPAWITAVHLAFMAFAVLTAHYPGLFIGGFLFFLGFARATAPYQDAIDLRPPMLVGFFLAGLVIHGGLQGWWIQPILSRLPELPLFLGGAALTAFNDNALITYLATLVPNLNESLQVAVVSGAVVGGGLTVIANAPNPAGQALLGRFFENGIRPTHLLMGAAVPTAIAALVFRLI